MPQVADVFLERIADGASAALSLSAAVFDGAVSERRAIPKKGGDPESGPWYRDLPAGTAASLPAIRKFAADHGKIAWKDDEGHDIFSGRINGQLLIQEFGIGIPVEYGVLGNLHSDVVDVPWPTGKFAKQIKSLCYGEWTAFGVGQVRLSRSALLPIVSLDQPSGLLAIEWPKPVTMRIGVWEKGGPIRRFFGRLVKSWSTTDLARLVIFPAVGDDPPYVDIQLRGAIRNNLPPRLNLK